MIGLGATRRMPLSSIQHRDKAILSLNCDGVCTLICHLQ